MSIFVNLVHLPELIAVYFYWFFVVVGLPGSHVATFHRSFVIGSHLQPGFQLSIDGNPFVEFLLWSWDCFILQGIKVLLAVLEFTVSFVLVSVMLEERRNGSCPEVAIFTLQLVIGVILVDGRKADVLLPIVALPVLLVQQGTMLVHY